jgi:hypothetical protein
MITKLITAACLLSSTIALAQVTHTPEPKNKISATIHKNFDGTVTIDNPMFFVAGEYMRPNREIGVCKAFGYKISLAAKHIMLGGNPPCVELDHEGNIRSVYTCGSGVVYRVICNLPINEASKKAAPASSNSCVETEDTKPAISAK